jgi:TorA maturation chaperone TorD
MRWLIEQGVGVDEERRCFFEFLAPAVEPLCTAIEAASRAQFYRRAAAFLRAYCNVERDAFELMTPE